jgi:CBS domain-containing protein
MLKPFDLVARSLLIVGGLNWLSVASGKFDLVAEATRGKFGRPNIVTRVFYGLVGGAALWSLSRLIEQSAFPKRPASEKKQIREAMTPDPQSVSPGTPVSEVARVMKSADVGSVPIVENGRLVGIVTDRDIAVRVVADAGDPNNITVGEVSSGRPISVAPDQPLHEALRLMARHQVRRLPVVEGERLVGMLAQADVASEAEESRTGEVVERIST